MKIIGIAFAGSGFARKVQAPCFAMCKGAKLIGASSPNNGKDFAHEFGMQTGTSDWKELIRREDVNLVCIASPPALHYEQTMYALEHGKHVLCEKPFALNLQQAKEMAAMASEKKVLAIVDHELRLSPGFRYVKKILGEGMLGKIYFASAISHIYGRRNPSYPYNWWYDKSWGGGAWGAIGSHLVDTLRYFAGDIAESYPVISTVVTERTDLSGKKHPVTSDEIGACCLKFRNGATGYAFTSTVSNENRFDIEITGEKGSIKVDMNDVVWFASEGKGYEKAEVLLGPSEKEVIERHEKANILARSMFSRAFMFMADRIVRTLQEGKTVIEEAATFEDGIKVQELMDKGWGR